MRIIAGSRKGARIFAPKGLDTRPTSDRVREAAFTLIPPGCVNGAGVLVYETGARTQPEVPGLRTRTSRRYGSARLTLFEQ